MYKHIQRAKLFIRTNLEIEEFSLQLLYEKSEDMTAAQILRHMEKNKVIDTICPVKIKKIGQTLSKSPFFGNYRNQDKIKVYYILDSVESMLQENEKGIHLTKNEVCSNETFLEVGTSK